MICEGGRREEISFWTSGLYGFYAFARAFCSRSNALLFLSFVLVICQQNASMQNWFPKKSLLFQKKFQPT